MMVFFLCEMKQNKRTFYLFRGANQQGVSLKDTKVKGKGINGWWKEGRNKKRKVSCVRYVGRLILVSGGDR